MPVFEEALNTLRKLGATVIDPADIPTAEQIVFGDDENFVLDVDFKVSYSILHSTEGSQTKLGIVDPTERLLRCPESQPERSADPRAAYRIQ